MRTAAALLVFMFIALQGSAQYSVKIVVKDTVCANEPFMVSYTIEGRGAGVQVIPQMKFERTASEGVVQLNEKLLASRERMVKDTLIATRSMGYLFVPSHDGEIILPVGRFIGKDTVTVPPRKIFVLNKKITSQDSGKIVQSRMLLFSKASFAHPVNEPPPGPAPLSMRTNVSNPSPGLNEEFTISWEINSLSVTPVIPSKKEIEKNFIIISGPVSMGGMNSEHSAGTTKLEYTVKARRAGKCIVNGATAKVDGKSLKGEPVEIIVR